MTLCRYQLAREIIAIILSSGIQRKDVSENIVVVRAPEVNISYRNIGNETIF